MKPRPRTLRESLAATPSATTVADAFDGESSASEYGAEVPRRGILVRVSPALRRQLKLIAFNRGLTVQAMMLEAIAGLLNQHDRPPLP